MWISALSEFEETDLIQSIVDRHKASGNNSLDTISSFFKSHHKCHKGIQDSVIRVYAIKILQNQAFLLFKISLIRFKIEYPKEGEKINDRVYNMKPEDFTPDDYEIEEFIKRPKFMWRFSFNTYAFFCSNFSNIVTENCKKELLKYLDQADLDKCSNVINLRHIGLDISGIPNYLSDKSDHVKNKIRKFFFRPIKHHVNKKKLSQISDIACRFSSKFDYNIIKDLIENSPDYYIHLMNRKNFNEIHFIQCLITGYSSIGPCDLIIYRDNYINKFKTIKPHEQKWDDIDPIKKFPSDFYPIDALEFLGWINYKSDTSKIMNYLTIVNNDHVYEFFYNRITLDQNLRNRKIVENQENIEDFLRNFSNYNYNCNLDLNLKFDNNCHHTNADKKSYNKDNIPKKTLVKTISKKTLIFASRDLKQPNIVNDNSRKSAKFKTRLRKNQSECPKFLSEPVSCHDYNNLNNSNIGSKLENRVPYMKERDPSKSNQIGRRKYVISYPTNVMYSTDLNKLKIVHKNISTNPPVLQRSKPYKSYALPNKLDENEKFYRDKDDIVASLFLPISKSKLPRTKKFNMDANANANVNASVKENENETENKNRNENGIVYTPINDNLLNDLSRDQYEQLISFLNNNYRYRQRNRSPSLFDD